MLFKETRLKGAFVIELDKQYDERGYFARAWCQQEFEAQGLNSRVVQCNLSFNRTRGTLRGMHYQVAPYEEAKVMRCISGAIYDVMVDLRPDSPTYREWVAVELTAENGTMLYVPPGVACGFLTLQDRTEVFYQMSEFYHPECARGVRWDDPAIGIHWPLTPRCVSQRDRAYPLLGDRGGQR